MDGPLAGTTPQSGLGSSSNERVHHTSLLDAVLCHTQDISIWGIQSVYSKSH